MNGVKLIPSNGWLVCCFGLNGSFISSRHPERERKRKKKKKRKGIDRSKIEETKYHPYPHPSKKKKKKTTPIPHMMQAFALLLFPLLLLTYYRVMPTRMRSWKSCRPYSDRLLMSSLILVSRVCIDLSA